PTSVSTPARSPSPTVSPLASRTRNFGHPSPTRWPYRGSPCEPLRIGLTATPVSVAPGGEAECEPVPARIDRVRRVHPRGRGGFLDLCRRHVPVPSGLGDEHPDVSPIIQGDHGVRDEVGKIRRVAVVVAPPHEGSVRDEVVLLVLQVFTTHGFNRRAEIHVDVVVVTKLLNHLPGLETKPSIKRGAGGLS